MGSNLARKLIASHLVSGGMEPGTEIGLRIDQTLTQEATGTMVMLEREALGLERVATDVSVQYVDYKLLHLRRIDVAKPGGERFDKLEFISRVAARAGVNESKAAMLSHAVAGVADDATDGMVSTKVAPALPDDIGALLMFGLAASV